DRVEGRMPVEGNRQPFGLLHGGASCVLAESLGSTGAFLHAEKLGKISVGIEINATHHRSATEGHVYGVAVPAHQGRTLSTGEITVSDDAGCTLCTSRLSCTLRDAPAKHGHRTHGGHITDPHPWHADPRIPPAHYGKIPPLARHLGPHVPENANTPPRER